MSLSQITSYKIFFKYYQTFRHDLPPISDTIQFGIVMLATAKRSAAKKNAIEIILSLSIFLGCLFADQRSFKGDF